MTKLREERQALHQATMVSAAEDLHVPMSLSSAGTAPTSLVTSTPVSE